MTDLISNILVVSLFLFIPIGLIIDISLKDYSFNNKYLNSFLIFVMLFGHPLYFSLSISIILLLDEMLFTWIILYNSISYYGYIILIIITLLFGLFRFMVYIFIFKKDITFLYKYCKFYAFTLLGVPLYLSIFNMKLEFYLVYIYQLFIPILIIQTIFYTTIKLFILKFFNKGKK